MWAVRVALQRPYSFVVLASLNRDKLEADIGLMLALGGGWTVSPEPPSVNWTPVPVQLIIDQTGSKP